MQTTLTEKDYCLEWKQNVKMNVGLAVNWNVVAKKQHPVITALFWW
jgi:hypothetical protein